MTNLRCEGPVLTGEEETEEDKGKEPEGKEPEAEGSEKQEGSAREHPVIEELLHYRYNITHLIMSFILDIIRTLMTLRTRMDGKQYLSRALPRVHQMVTHLSHTG